jgi:hypothetical protein
VRNIDLTSFTFKLFNFYVKDIILNKNNLIVSTTEGDLLEININQKNEGLTNSLIKNKSMVINIKINSIIPIFLREKE